MQKDKGYCFSSVILATSAFAEECHCHIMLLSRFTLPLPFWGLLYFICGRIKGGGERWNIQLWLFAPIILNETEKRRHLSRFLFITMIFIVILFLEWRIYFLKEKSFLVVWRRKRFCLKKTAKKHSTCRKHVLFCARN